MVGGPVEERRDWRMLGEVLTVLRARLGRSVKLCIQWPTGLIPAARSPSEKYHRMS
jgi:hypothetical protein